MAARVINLLLYIGLVTRRPDGTVRGPLHIPPYEHFWHYVKFGPRVYVFRNLPGVIKWLPGRLLPRRWGIGICGFEFGDRG